MVCTSALKNHLLELDCHLGRLLVTRNSIQTHSNLIPNVSWDQLRMFTNVERTSEIMYLDSVEGNNESTLFNGLTDFSLIRKCPGSHLADPSIWLLIACMMATLNIKKPLDENGNVIEPDHTFDSFIFLSVLMTFVTQHFSRNIALECPLNSNATCTRGPKRLSC